MRGAVEDGDPLLPRGDLFREHLKGGTVAIGDQGRTLLPAEGRRQHLHVGELLRHDPAQTDLAVLPEEHPPEIANPHFGAGRLPALGPFGPLAHQTREHRPPRFAPLLHRGVEFLGRHVGMDEVRCGIVDLVELEREAEHLCQALLGIADRA